MPLTSLINDRKLEDIIIIINEIKINHIYHKRGIIITSGDNSNLSDEMIYIRDKFFLDENNYFLLID